MSPFKIAREMSLRVLRAVEEISPRLTSEMTMRLCHGHTAPYLRTPTCRQGPAPRNRRLYLEAARVLIYSVNNLAVELEYLFAREASCRLRYSGRKEYCVSRPTQTGPFVYILEVCPCSSRFSFHNGSYNTPRTCGPHRACYWILKSCRRGE